MKEARVFHIGNSRQKLLRIASMLSSFLVTETDDLEIEIRERRKEKSHRQRKAWHALLTEFGKALGYTLPEIKQVVKEEIFGVEVKTLPNGKSYRITQSSEEEDRYGYSNLIEQTMRIAAENGVLLNVKEAA